MALGGELIPGTQYEDTPEEYEGPIEFVNWNGFKIAAHGASRLTTEFFDEIQARRNNNQAVIIIITGTAGEGKSWFGLRFCEIFDKDFDILDDEDPAAVNPGSDPSQVPFERESFLFLIGNQSPLKYGQCVLPDEAQYAAGARRWYEDLQKDLMEQIESVRSKGYIIVFVALHLELLDKIVRKYVLTYMFHAEERGKVTVYRLYTPRFEREMRKRRLGQIYLRVPNYEQCPNPDCLRCRYLPPSGKTVERKCMALRARYERRKRQFVGRRASEAQAKAQVQALRDRVIPDGDFLKVLRENDDQLTRNRIGRVNPAAIRNIIKGKFNIDLGVSKVYALRSYLEEEDPEKYGPEKERLKSGRR